MAAAQGVDELVCVVHMGKQTDIFDLFGKPRSASSELLIRVEDLRCHVITNSLNRIKL